jgi:hypothetical protein
MGDSRQRPAQGTSASSGRRVLSSGSPPTGPPVIAQNDGGASCCAWPQLPLCPRSWGGQSLPRNVDCRFCG